MTFHRVRAGLLTGLHPVRDVTPVIGRDVAGVDAGALYRVDMAQHVFDLGQPSIFRRISPPGRTKGSV